VARGAGYFDASWHLNARSTWTSRQRFEYTVKKITPFRKLDPYEFEVDAINRS